MYNDFITAELDYIFGGLSPYEAMELDDILRGEYDDDDNADDLVTVKDYIDAQGHCSPVWLSFTDDAIMSDRFSMAADIPPEYLNALVFDASYDAQGELNLLINPHLITE